MATVDRLPLQVGSAFETHAVGRRCGVAAPDAGTAAARAAGCHRRSRRRRRAAGQCWGPHNARPTHGWWLGPRHIMPRHIMPRHIMPRHIMPRHIMPMHIMPRHIMPRHMLPPLGTQGPELYFRTFRGVNRVWENIFSTCVVTPMCCHTNHDPRNRHEETTCCLPRSLSSSD